MLIDTAGRIHHHCASQLVLSSQDRAPVLHVRSNGCQQCHQCYQTSLRYATAVLLPALQDTLVELAYAGHSTGTSSITRLLWLLPQQPAVLARLRAEQQEVVAQHGEAITEAVLRDSPYLDAVVRESLRLHVSAS
jgi:hypothetical protein